MSFLRSHATQYHIAKETFDENDIHVHVPAGAVPKDGPSAGVTMLAALTSLLTDTPVMPRLAMTGEITLSGQVLPVGGIKEKILAAQRAGVETVILPKRNEKDYLEDVPADIRKLLRAHFVSDAEQVLKIALNK
jgi:ATP-dependent Lon protease